MTRPLSELSYTILGGGALGGYYGGLLQRSGLSTRFLLRSDLHHVRAHGLRVDSKDGDFHLPAVEAFGDPAELPPADVVVVALKTVHNHQLPTLLAGSLKPDGVVLVLENGLNPEADAAAVVGAERVLGGLCFLCSNKAGPGHIQHVDFGHIDMGTTSTSPAVRDRLESVVADFSAAGIPTRAVEDLRAARWRKLVWNVPYNGLSVVLNATTDRLMADPDTRRLIVRLMDEVVASARAAEGVEIEAAFVQKMLDYTDAMVPYKTSMMLDHEAGRPMEIEAIIGDPVRAARAAGYEPPAMAMLIEQLRFIDRRNRKD